LPLILAVCGDPEPLGRLLWLTVPVLGAGLYLWALRAAFTEGRAMTRRRLGIVLLVTLACGAVIATTPGGLSDGDADYLARFWTGLGMGVAIGGGAAAWNHERMGRFVVVGGLGGGGFMAWATGLLVFLLAAGNTCLA
jgi:hypothetical protein